MPPNLVPVMKVMLPSKSKWREIMTFRHSVLVLSFVSDFSSTPMRGVGFDFGIYAGVVGTET